MARRKTRTAAVNPARLHHPAQAPQPTGGQNFRVTAKLHHGPIPDPETLQRYDEISPGAASLIINMAMKEQAHRHQHDDELRQAEIQHNQQVMKLEEKRLDKIFRSDLFGQITGSTVSVIALVGAGFAVYQDEPWVASVFLSMPVLGIVKALRGSMSKGGKLEVDRRTQ